MTIDRNTGQLKEHNFYTQGLGQRVKRLTASASGYAITGIHIKGSAGNAEEMFLMHTDSPGSTQWYKTHGGLELDGAFGLLATNDGYVMAGFSNSYNSGATQAYIVRTNLEGSADY